MLTVFFGSRDYDERASHAISGQTLTLLLAAAAAVVRGLPITGMSENFRMRLRDMWNLRALTHTDGSIVPAETTRAIELGAPREQGHYGFMLTDLYLYPLLAGLSVDIPAGKLSFAPKYPAPYSVPLLLAGVVGSLRSPEVGTYTLTVAFGSLKLPAGGLSVHGAACPKAVELVEGQSITWTTPDTATTAN